MKKIALLLCLLLAAQFTIRAQSFTRTYPDLGLWNTINISASLNKKYTLLFTEEIRFRDNIQRLNLLYNNFGIEYELNNYISTSITYRNIQKYLETNRFSIRHRIMWDVDCKYPYKKWAFKYRSRLQTEERNINSSDDANAEWFWRNKFGASYKINKKWGVNLASEIRLQIYDPRATEYNVGVHRNRFQAGLAYKKNKALDFEVYYLFQNEFGVASAENQYIIGLEMNYKLLDLFAQKKKK